MDCDTDEQLDVIRRLWRGEEGGLAFEIYNFTLVEPTAVERAQADITLDGPRSRIVVGDAIDAAMAPLLDPVTGEENIVRVVKPEGFDWKDGQIAQVDRLKVNAPGVSFEHTGKHAAFFAFEYAPE